MASLPKYTKGKMKGNIGEALVQYLLSHFCLVHKIDGSSDVGNDFICELIKDEYPTNLLFYAQVKFRKTAPSLSQTTKEYWKGSPIPVYLFWVKGEPPVSFLHDRQLNFEESKKYYKRMTPKIHRPDKHKRERFKLFSEREFKHDLIIDYARSQYRKGFTPIIEPRAFLALGEKIDLGLPQYWIMVKDVIPEYSDQILKRSWVNLFVTAKLLTDRGGYADLEKALKAIDLAQTLFMESEDREDKQSFIWVIESSKQLIVRKLSELNGQ